jgi:hypothetical protein
VKLSLSGLSVVALRFAWHGSIMANKKAKNHLHHKYFLLVQYRKTIGILQIKVLILIVFVLFCFLLVQALVTCTGSLRCRGHKIV